MRENGTYHIHIHIHEPGTVEIGIQKDTGINPGRYQRDIFLLLQKVQSLVFPTGQ
jgi:hypothetical protein